MFQPVAIAHREERGSPGMQTTDFTVWKNAMLWQIFMVLNCRGLVFLIKKSRCVDVIKILSFPVHSCTDTVLRNTRNISSC